MVVRQEAREEIKFVYAKAKGGITQAREQTERLAWVLGCGAGKRHCNVFWLLLGCHRRASETSGGT